MPRSAHWAPGTATELWAQRLALTPAVDTPTITVVTKAAYDADNTTGVVGGTLIAPARIGGVAGADPEINGDPCFRY